MKVCLFSSYSETSTVDNYVVDYLKELTRFHDEVIYITNERDLCVTPINTLGVKVMFVENDGYDFGMWSKALKTINRNRVDRLTLVNDSCLLVKPLTSFFEWEKDNGFDYSGITNSLDHSYHIQSYFVVIKKPAIKSVFEFFDSKEYFSKTIGLIVQEYEVGLSKALILSKFKIGAMYHLEKYREPLKTNPIIYFAKELLIDGCPLIKKKVILNSFRGDEFAVLKNCGYDFDFDFKDFFKSELGFSDALVKRLFTFT